MNAADSITETLMRIRQSTVDDLGEVVRIWREGSTASLGIDLPDGDYPAYFAAKIRDQDDTFQLWVQEDSDGSIMGWQSLFPFRNNPVVARLMAESSTYVCPRHHGKGVGRSLF